MENSLIWQNKLSVTLAEDESAKNEFCLEQSDAQLVNLVLAENEAAFEDIFEKYKRLVAVIAARYFRQPEQIEEIIQITFAKAYFELKTFRGKNDFSLASWLAKISANACLDVIKKNKRKPENLLCEFSKDESEIILSMLACSENVENYLVGRDLAEKLLSHLPPSERALLEMLFAEEMSVAEVAQIIGQSKANVKVRAFRARRALRKILKRFL